MQISGYSPFVNLQEQQTPFYAATVGNPKPQRVVHRPLGIPDHLLLYTVSGTGDCFINGKSYTLPEGSLLYLPPDVSHEYDMLDKGWETLYITFNGTGLRDFFQPAPCVCRLPASFNFPKKYNEIFNLKQAPQRFKELSGALYMLLLDLKEYLQPTAFAARSRHLLTLAMYCLTEEHGGGLREAAEKLGISEAHFCRIFKSYTGFRPMEYANLFKLQKAKNLLRNTDLSVAEVAAEIGYDSHSYFSMLFKKHTGVTPTQYRLGYESPVEP